MARNEQRRQKKLEARKAKRKEQQREVARSQSSGVQARLALAKNWPVIDARVTTSLWEDGIGYAAIARRGPHDQVAAAIFLLDVYCLGVKDVILFFDTESRWNAAVRRLSESGSHWINVSPEHVRKLCEGAVAYAQSFDLPPHRDWSAGALLFGDIDASQCLTEFTFGHDGKPYFIGGPNDSTARVNQIVQTLARTAGPDNFHFTAPINFDDLPTEIAEIVENGTAIGQG